MTAALLLVAALAGFPHHGPIYDGAGLFDVDQKIHISRAISDAAKEGVEVAVVTLPEPRVPDLRQLAREVQNDWGLGQNSVVYLVTMQPKTIWVQPGEGYRGKVASVDSERIAKEVIAPRFRDGDYEAGTLAGIGAFEDIVRPRPCAPPDHTGSYLGFAFVCVLISGVFGYLVGRAVEGD